MIVARRFASAGSTTLAIAATNAARTLVGQRERALRLVDDRQPERGDDAVGQLPRPGVARPAAVEPELVELLDERGEQRLVVGERGAVADERRRVERRIGGGDLGEHAVEPGAQARVVEPTVEVTRERAQVGAGLAAVEELRAELHERRDLGAGKLDRHGGAY